MNLCVARTLVLLVLFDEYVIAINECQYAFVRANYSGVKIMILQYPFIRANILTM
jgi:hypothetical protein